MHKLEGKICPLINNRCLLKGCALFSERLDGCEISIMNYNLYVLKEQIRAQLNLEKAEPVQGAGKGAGGYKPARYPRPAR